MLSFSPLAVEQLSESPELPGFCGSSDSLFFRHINLRLTTLAKVIPTTTRMTMKLITPKATTVSIGSAVGLGWTVTASLVCRLVVTELGVTFRDISPLVLLTVLLLLPPPSGVSVPAPSLIVWFCGCSDVRPGKERE